MQKFSNFLEENFIQESLDSPIEFYMTDDTKMPKEIYATFDIDGTQYGMSLIYTLYDKVYMLDMYRIVNVKKRSWSFIKPQHIRKCLSSLIKFMEASYPFLQSKMNGIIIDIPGKTGSEKYVSFLGRILKRSYIKKFREIPVVKTSDKARNYLFLVKKGIEPSSLFTTAAFHKNFKFENGNAVFDDQIMDQTTEPYKVIKQTVSIEPSKKFAFGAAQVELMADEETINMLDKASELYKINQSTTKPVKKQENYTAAINLDFTKEIISSGNGGVGFGENKSSKVLGLSLPHIMALILPSAYAKVQQYGYDASKFNENDLTYATNQGLSNVPEKIKKELIDAGMLTTSGSLNTAAANIETIKACLAAFMYIEKDKLVSFKNKIEEKLVNKADPKPKAKGKKGVQEYKLDLEKEPVSVLEAFTSSNESTPYGGVMGFVEGNEDINAKKTAVIKMPEIEQWYNSFDGSSEKGQNTLVNYTGSNAYEINSTVRNLVNNKDFNFEKIPDYGNDVKNQIITLTEYFKKAPRLENGIWVYRNADTPGVEKYQVGDDYIDAAFLSTSLKSSMSLSSNGNLRLKIYVPKGTRCFPILEKSQHSHEDEIVLPPMSLLRITEIYDNIKEEGHRMMVCAMIGSAFEDMLELGKKGVMLEEKKPEKKKEYDPAGKWGAPTSSYDDAMLVKKLMVKGVIKSKK